MIQSTAIIGMGALGLLYADRIVKKRGKNGVTFVLDKDRMQKYKDVEFSINGEKKLFQMAVADDMKPVDLVIVAVKYNGLHSAIEMMKNCVGENTIIMSVMNGIDSEEIIADTFGKEHLIYTVAQGMDAMKFGNDLNYTKEGELRIGIVEESQKKNLEDVCCYFDDVSMPYAVEENIMKRMWSKFMLNVGVNQTCHAFETTYAGVLKEGSEENKIFIGAMNEVIALSQAVGIGLTEEDAGYYIDIVKTLKPEGVPSMRQDGIAKRKSEVEMFAGTVKRLAGKYGIKTPVNDLLYDKIKGIERNLICLR